jgi:hypothetical protein
MTDAEEKAYMRGQAMMASQLMDFASKFTDQDQSAQLRAGAIVERARIAIIAIGRDYFGEEWEADLHLEDLIEKRLRPALDEDAP